MANTKEAASLMKEAYVNQASNDIEQAYRDVMDISKNPEFQLVDGDDDVMFEIPLANQIRIKLYDPTYTRIVLRMLYDKSGILMPSCGGRDSLGNAWVKMQCVAHNPISRTFEKKTEAILWILIPNLMPQDDPIEYAKSVRQGSGVPENNWWNVPLGEVPEQATPIMD